MTEAGSFSWTGRAAAAWAVVFGAIHAAWALGWRAGLTPGQAANADTSPAFAAYALAVVGICGVAAVMALAMARPHPPRHAGVARALEWAAWTGTTILVVRAGGSIVPLATSLLRGAPLDWVLPWEPWFWLGAALFGTTSWRYHRLRRSSARVEKADPRLATSGAGSAPAGNLP